MLSLLDEMERWAGQHRKGRDDVSVVYRRGRVDLPKQSADIALESPSTLGTVAVWETGEIEAEVVEIESMNRVFVVSGVVHDESGLRDVLTRALEAMRGAPS